VALKDYDKYFHVLIPAAFAAQKKTHLLGNSPSGLLFDAILLIYHFLVVITCKECNACQLRLKTAIQTIIHG